VASRLPTRLLDAVAVKGKSKGVRIFTVARSLSPALATAWELHNRAMELYFDRQFEPALAVFDQVLGYLPDDFNAQEMRGRCEEYRHDPPGQDWDGVKIMKHK
jgi:adenylate cyclase